MSTETPKKRVAWNKGLTKETDPRVLKNAMHTKETVLQRYGTTSVLASKEVKERVSEDRHSGKIAQKAMQTKEIRYGDKNYNNYEKSQQTKLDRYGDKNFNNITKAQQTCLQKYGFEHPCMSDDVKQRISSTRIKEHSQDKAIQTILNKYGDLQDFYKVTAQKRYDTMTKNGTLGNRESAPEKEMYSQLCSIYGEDNVKRQYFDKERYPFKCDFYIVPEDKFIELHGFFTHGPHAFNPNDAEDIKLLEQLKARDDDWAKAIIYTWTDLDVRKLEIAKKNNLNFEAIYWYDN